MELSNRKAAEVEWGILHGKTDIIVPQDTRRAKKKFMDRVSDFIIKIKGELGEALTLISSFSLVMFQLVERFMDVF